MRDVWVVSVVHHINSDPVSIHVCTPLGVFVLELVQDRGSELVLRHRPLWQSHETCGPLLRFRVSLAATFLDNVSLFSERFASSHPSQQFVRARDLASSGLH